MRPGTFLQKGVPAARSVHAGPMLQVHDLGSWLQPRFLFIGSEYEHRFGVVSPRTALLTSRSVGRQPQNGVQNSFGVVSPGTALLTTRSVWGDSGSDSPKTESIPGPNKRNGNPLLPKIPNMARCREHRGEIW